VLVDIQVMGVMVLAGLPDGRHPLALVVAAAVAVFTTVVIMFLARVLAAAVLAYLV
jgi:hypothetical protein